MTEQVLKEPKPKEIKDEDDKPDYQEKITFLVSTASQVFILGWCLVVLSLGYVRLPTKLFGVEIPDQPRVDSTFAAGLLGNILGGLGISVNAAAGAKKKKKEGEGSASLLTNNGDKVIIVKQPIELIAKPAEVRRVDPITNRPIGDDGKLS